MDKEKKDTELWQMAAQGFANSDKVLSLDLHGLTIFEASPILEGFLNEQFMQGVEVVKVICGIGTGKLMQGVKKILEEYKKFGLVEEYYVPNSGGVFVVRLGN